MNSRQEFFVHVDLGGESPVVAGFHEFDSRTNIGTFIYGRSYCENPNAFALDPINLPLIYEKHFQLRSTRINPFGIPGVIHDGGPDEWGRRLLNRFCEDKPITPADYLVMGSGYGVGALYFSDSPEQPMQTAQSANSDIHQLYQSILAFDSVETVDKNLQYLLMPSSGIGGARPKTHVLYENRPYIAKFNRRDDPFDNALAEYCMMKIAQKAGINCANVKLVSTQQGNAILVERFDNPQRQQLQPRRHMISINALMDIQDIPDLENASYDRIVTIGKKIGRENNVNADVFKRMLFNIAIGNTDDHTRNHAFLKNTHDRSYTLSPAYDLVPLPIRIGSHAINIGPFGQTPTLENIYSAGRLMGLDNQQQAQSAQSIVNNLQNLKATLSEFNMLERDIEYLMPCFRYADLVGRLCDTALRLD